MGIGELGDEFEYPVDPDDPKASEAMTETMAPKVLAPRPSKIRAMDRIKAVTEMSKRSRRLYTKDEIEAIDSLDAESSEAEEEEEEEEEKKEPQATKPESTPVPAPAPPATTTDPKAAARISPIGAMIKATSDHLTKIFDGQTVPDVARLEIGGAPHEIQVATPCAASSAARPADTPDMFPADEEGHSESALNDCVDEGGCRCGLARLLDNRWPDYPAIDASLGDHFGPRLPTAQKYFADACHRVLGDVSRAGAPVDWEATDTVTIKGHKYSARGGGSITVINGYPHCNGRPMAPVEGRLSFVSNVRGWGSGRTWVGDNNDLHGDRVRAYGHHIAVTGDDCTIFGHYNRVTGDRCTVVGDDCVVVGNHCVIRGVRCKGGFAGADIKAASVDLDCFPPPARPGRVDAESLLGTELLEVAKPEGEKEPKRRRKKEETPERDGVDPAPGVVMAAAAAASPSVERGIDWMHVELLTARVGKEWDMVLTRLHELLEFNDESAAPLFTDKTIHSATQLFQKACDTGIPPWMIQQALSAAGCEMAANVLDELVSSNCMRRACSDLNLPPPEPAPAPARHIDDSESRPLSEAQVASMPKGVDDWWPGVMNSLRKLLSDAGRPEFIAFNPYSIHSGAEFFEQVRTLGIEKTLICQAISNSGGPPLPPVARARLEAKRKKEMLTFLEQEPAPAPSAAAEHRGITDDEVISPAAVVGKDWDMVLRTMRHLLGCDALITQGPELITSGEKMFREVSLNGIDRSTVRQAIGVLGLDALAAAEAILGPQQRAPVPAPPAPSVLGHCGITVKQADMMANAFLHNWQPILKELHAILDSSGHHDAHRFTEDTITCASGLFHSIHVLGLDASIVRRALVNSGYAAKAWAILETTEAAPAPAPAASVPVHPWITPLQRDRLALALTPRGEWKKVRKNLWKRLAVIRDDNTGDFAKGRVNNSVEFFSLVFLKHINILVIKQALVDSGHRDLSEFDQLLGDGDGDWFLASDVVPARGPAPAPSASSSTSSESIVPEFKDVDAKKGEPTCVVCMENRPQLALPCGHFCLCGKCAKALATDQGKGVACPICRTVATCKLLRIFPCQ